MNIGPIEVEDEILNDFITIYLEFDQEVLTIEETKQLRDHLTKVIDEFETKTE